jgi:predicted TIM-barrel enzyme
MVELSSSTTINIIIPNNSTVAFPTGSQITFIQTGTQNTTFITGSGVTINSFNNNNTLTGQYSVATCVKKTTNTWYLFGDLS